MNLSLFILLFFSGNSFVKDYPPPGTVQLSDNLYIDTEYISVQSWKEYILIKERNNETPFYPDTSYLVNGLNYYNSGSFDSEPIIKITYEAMQDYVQWRMDYINEGLDNFSSKNQCKPKFYVKTHKKNIRVAYRIASKEEFLLAKEKDLIAKENQNETYTKENWNEFSSFRCVASFVYLEE